VTVLDPALPAMKVITDRAALGKLLAKFLVHPRVEEAAVRLRWKPGTNIRAGVVAPTATGPAAVLLAAFAGAGHKADTVVDAARRLGAPVLRVGSLVVVPAEADPALRGLVPSGARPLAYNPARRWVGRIGGQVLKVHAGGGRLAVAPWVEGRLPGVADGPAVATTLAALHAEQPPPGLPVLDVDDVLVAAERAGAAVAVTLPEVRGRIDELLAGLRTALPAAWPTDRVVMHGDLSPDQVLIRDDGAAVLLDLDRIALGPSGWDGAHWTAAQLATGEDRLPPPVPAPPALLAAACLLRAPEPFRRLRPGWVELTNTLLDTAHVNAVRRGRSSRRSRAWDRVPAGLTVRRSWPERSGGLAVEALTPQGRVVGVWVRGTDVTVLDTHDPALPALTPGATVIRHRPGRRAVLRTADGYRKVVRPGRAAAVARRVESAWDLLGADPTAPLLPTVLDVDDTTGAVQLAELAGPTLHELLAEDGAAALTLAGRTGAALATLQHAPSDGLPAHGHREEAEVLRRWTADAARWGGDDRSAAAEQVATRLATLPAPQWAPAHRDLHDKQLVAAGNRVGLLDLDTLCRADPALDLANLLAHLQLRVLQGHCLPAVAERCAAALQASAGGRAGAAALATYTAATLLRLAAVYSFRPGHPDLPARLTAAATV
jgi:aminoglycoside phosphotransferase (APT) family kinase protein